MEYLSNYKNSIGFVSSFSFLFVLSLNLNECLFNYDVKKGIN